MSTSISATEIGLPDNAKLKLGTGEDLELYHDGTNTYLDNNTGQFNIDAASGNAIRFLVNGSYQCQVYTSGIDLPDNKKLRLGDSEDLEIYHDGSNSHIQEVGTGSLLIKSDAVNLGSASGEYYFRGFENGAVQLRYDNSTKLETISTGLNVTGGVRLGGNNSANELDDYEEGTWTPDWRGASALGTTTYGTHNTASYVKIGNQVTVRGFTELNGSSGGSGFWFINNLPFTVGGGDNRAYRSVGSVMIENYDFNSDVTDVVIYVERNNNDAQLRSNRDAASSGASISVNNDTNFEIQFTVTYPTV